MKKAIIEQDTVEISKLLDNYEIIYEDPSSNFDEDNFIYDFLESCAFVDIITFYKFLNINAELCKSVSNEAMLSAITESNYMLYQPIAELNVNKFNEFLLEACLYNEENIEFFIELGANNFEECLEQLSEDDPNYAKIKAMI